MTVALAVGSSAASPASPAPPAVGVGAGVGVGVAVGVGVGVGEGFFANTAGAPIWTASRNVKISKEDLRNVFIGILDKDYCVRWHRVAQLALTLQVTFRLWPVSRTPIARFSQVFLKLLKTEKPFHFKIVIFALYQMIQ